MESTKQTYINGIIFKNKMKETWLAEEMSKQLHAEITPQVLNYQLHGANEIKENYYKAIIEIFKSAELVADRDNVCKELGRITLSITYTLNSQLSLLQKEIAAGIEDDDLDEDEKLKIKSNIPELKLAIKEAINKIDLLERMIDTVEAK